MKVSNFFRVSPRRRNSIQLQNKRRLHLESLEQRKVFDAGWAVAMQSALVSEVVGDAAGNQYSTGSLSNASYPANLGGITFPVNPLRDIFIAKQNTTGQFLWAVKAGNPLSSNDSSRGIAVDDAGDVFIAGSFDGTAQFGSISLTSVGGQDGFLAKLDGATGQFLWARSLGGSGKDASNAIAVDATGNVVVTHGLGMLATSSNDAPELTITKFDTHGTALWSESVSGTLSGALLSVETDENSDIYIGGRFQGTADFPTGTLVSTAHLPSPFGYPVSDGLIAKLDASGNWLWAKSLSGDSATFVTNMIVGPDQQLYITGKFEGTTNLDGNLLVSSGGADILVAGVQSSTGTLDWAQRMGGTLEEVSAGPLAFDPQGNLNIAGTFRGTADFGSTTLTTDGGIENAFVSKLTPQGTVLDTHRVITGTISGTTNIGIGSVSGLHSDALGNLYISGWFAGGTVHAPQQALTANSGSGFAVKLPPAAPTKFYVVNDSSKDRTYQYGETTELTIDNFSLNTGNTSPRGAASNAAGTTIWVADKNRKVYVYSSSGTQQGSWTAGSLSSKAQVEGVATNGLDVWIVDSKTDKVFRYAGAASRTSGSGTAASSFALNSANSNPKGIVTDGTNLWVLNDSTTDKIFKYTINGNYLGSWTIDSANKSPTGLTIDPSDGSQDIWVVDNGTDKIYQYSNSRSRTSGSQVANAVYSLAVGNTNPQGIADPPPAETLFDSAPASPSLPLIGAQTIQKSSPLFDRAIEELQNRVLLTSFSGQHGKMTVADNLSTTNAVRLDRLADDCLHDEVLTNENFAEPAELLSFSWE